MLPFFEDSSPIKDDFKKTVCPVMQPSHAYTIARATK